MRNDEITELLEEVHKGNVEAKSQLASLVYDELHRLASWYMYGERKNHTLQTTALVHEAFVHLVNSDNRSFRNRSHFFAAAAQVMRRILIDYARNRGAEKRGCGQHKVQLDEAIVFSNENFEEWIAVDDALNHLAERDSRLARIVEMRFYAGLTEEEIGEVLGVSSRTVKREWRVAKAWLRAELSHVKADDPGSVAAHEEHHG
jgi:RNA polymerase sigma factor (TIGR02999 family)